jgi:hypothetical protein
VRRRIVAMLMGWLCGVRMGMGSRMRRGSVDLGSLGRKVLEGGVDVLLCLQHCSAGVLWMGFLVALRRSCLLLWLDRMKYIPHILISEFFYQNFRLGLDVVVRYDHDNRFWTMQFSLCIFQPSYPTKSHICSHILCNQHGYTSSPQIVLHVSPSPSHSPLPHSLMNKNYTEC